MGFTNRLFTAVAGLKSGYFTSFFPCSAGLMVGLCWKESQNPRYSPRVGAGIVTNDWCINSEEVPRYDYNS